MMRKTISIAILVLVSMNFANAQIKVVGDDYSSSLTGAKSYYEQDVDFEKYFPAISSKKLRKITPRLSGSDEDELEYIYLNLNLTGDTIYLLKDIVIESGTNVFYPSFCIDYLGKVDSDTMFAGYYEVVGYVFCTENEDSVRASLGITFDEYQYNNIGEEVDERRAVRANQKEEYSMKNLKEEILKENGDKVGLFVRYIVFRSLDTASKKKFYLSKEDHNVDDYMILLRFYNEALSFVGKEVIVTDNGYGYGYYGLEWCMMSKYIKTYRDPLSNTLIKIEDDVFKVKDIVMKDDDFYAIIEGEKTGSFAFKLLSIINVQGREKANTYNIYTDPDNDGNSQYLSAVPCLFCEKGDEHNNDYIVIIKKNDVRLLDQRAEMAKAQREKAWKQQEIKEKQEKAKKENEHKQQMITKYGSQFGSFVAKHQVAIGMSKEMCRDAWDKPMNTYRTTTKCGQSEVWCYNYKTRVYFYNGKVVQIDD